MPAAATSPGLAGRRSFAPRRRAGECPPPAAPALRRRPELDAHAVQIVYDDNAQRGLEHDEAVAATAMRLRVSVHQVQRAIAARGPAPTLATLATQK
jgi:hypothetical protein